MLNWYWVTQEDTPSIAGQWAVLGILQLWQKERKGSFCLLLLGLAWVIIACLHFLTRLLCLSYLVYNLKNSYVARASNQSPTHLMKLGARDQRWCHPRPNLHELSINFHKAWSIKHFSPNISQLFCKLSRTPPQVKDVSNKSMYVVLGGRGPNNGTPTCHIWTPCSS